MTSARLIGCFALLIAASPSFAEPMPLIAFAERHVAKQSTWERRLGLAELRRANGVKAVASDDADAGPLELACWRMLPVMPAQREAFRQNAAKLKVAQPNNAWVAVWELYLLAGESDRAALLAAIERMPQALPERFPGKVGEQAHLGLLQELGTPRVRAALQVIAARNHEPLHALRDLDRALSREADFHFAANRPKDAKAIVQVRDRLRQSYCDAAKHLVEKLFAFHLLGDAKKRDELLASSQGLVYLHDRQKLATLLERVDEEGAWTQLLQPLLESELKLIANPPDLGPLPLRAVAELQINADKKIDHGPSARYEGNVRFRLRGIELSCQHLTLIQDENPNSAILVATEKVQLRGIAEYPHGVFADRVAYQAETGTFTLSGDVRLHGYQATQKWRVCTMMPSGAVRDARSLLDDFRQMFTLDAKIELLPKISKVYTDDELPPEVRYLLALNLLRPHLDWHAPYLPPIPSQFERGDKQELLKTIRDVVRRAGDYFSLWQEASKGEPWMQADVPDAAQDAYRTKLRAWYQRVHAEPRNKPAAFIDLPIAGKDLYFWRIRDLRHADIARATRLLSGIHTDELNAKASRWRDEIGRNNTVLTFDIAAAAQLGKPHRMLMDARNAEHVAFKLYRVERPEELLYATKRIGKDFIYRDHDLDGNNELIKKRDWLDKESMRSITQRGESRSKEDHFEPNWKSSQLVHQWKASIADLKVHQVQRERRSYRDWNDKNWHDEADAHYFDDACSMYQARIEKEYRLEREDQLSSWQCDRIVEIPAKKLSEAGAYVLIAESNGVTATVPIVVEPLSLTLRRCRDGVFVLASDASGTKPLDGTQVYVRGQRGEAKTDAQGVAFARAFAAGDRAIVVHHQGRYAIGGFGQVFEGIYSSSDDDHRRLRDRLQRAKRGDAKDASASIYEDQHVIAAYTDRPTYRPGQDVHFKLIVRKLAPTTSEPAQATSFRSNEFDRASKMVLPDLESSIRYSIVDPKGREVEHGSLPLSEFGTAAGSLKLNIETVHGAYTFRVQIAGQWRIVPDVFAVMYYRRPNFEVVVEGVPAELPSPKTLMVTIASQYYFGPPVNGGAVEVRVVRANGGSTIVNTHEKLDAKGRGKVDVRLPKSMDAGRYLVLCSVTDGSGRTVTSTTPFTLDSPNATEGASGFDTLPRFVAVGQEIKIATKAKEVRAEQKITSLRFASKDGFATLKLSMPGWYQIKAGEDTTTIFAYGGSDHPRTFAVHEDDRDEAMSRFAKPKWVNLSDFAQEEHEHPSRWEKPSQHLYALFDRQSLDVGEKLRLLVYVPHTQTRLLFTMEGRTILDYAIVDAKAEAGAYRVIELPMKERYFPNFYLQGRLITNEVGSLEVEEKLQKLRVMEAEEDDGDADPQWCRINLRRANGKGDTAGLDVRVTTDREVYRPGDSVSAMVKVMDRAGKPMAAEVSLAAVDESVFAFGEDGLGGLPAFFGTPHEASRFQPKVWRTSIGNARERSQLQKDQVKASKSLMEAMSHMKSASKSIESLESLARPLQFIATPLPRLHGQMPSGQLPLTRLREHFRETATWVPQLRTDETGTARVAFTLPDSLTRYRLTSVALTKVSEVGVGRTRITAALPLAVQVFLPRFAMERDRVQAVAVVHNHSDQARTCQIAWHVEGAQVDDAEPVLKDWKLGNEAGKSVGTGTVEIAARGSAKVGLWLKLDQVGTVRLAVRATDSKDGDAEVRTFAVQALGKPEEVNANEQLAVIPVNKAAVKEIAGTFNKEGRIQLPKGFLAREVHLSLACSEVAQALEGLDHLMDYPHGCIEQTMSRFMPVVMIKHATRHSPIKLRPEVDAKLPDILQTGMARVYGHQHADGSWGWFERDGRNFAMSVYVVYGLARCQTAGTKVDAEILQRGCRYLQDELRANKQEPELAAKAWHALALAGHADARELAAWAKATLAQTSRGDVCAHLALACRSAGLVELGEQAYRKTKQWQPHDVETTALKLNTQIAYGDAYSDCHATARALLARRHGTIWNSTRDTAWAIEGLSNMLGFVPEKNLVRRVEVTIGGKKVLDGTKGDDLKKPIHRVHLQGAQLPMQDGIEIRMNVDSDEPIHVAFRAVGVQRLDEVKASGAQVQLMRTLESLDGEPIRGPLKVGEVVRVRLRLHLTEREEYVMIEERRPTLCEFADDHATGTAARSIVHQEFRDDRLCLFFASLNAGTHEVLYYLRAETAGRCTVLPGCAYPMYQDKKRGETGSSKLEVTAR